MNRLIHCSLPGILKVSGEEAKKLLQGQLTCDVEKLSVAPLLLGAHCNPQGRIISLFRLFQYQAAYYLLMPHSLVPIALAALKKYAIFYQVALVDVSHHAKMIDCHLPAIQSQLADPLAQKRLDIENGIPAIYPETTGKFLPHDINLPHLGAISFDKGCYTGQEIIARMHYRGKLKNRMIRAHLLHDSPPLPGEEIYCLHGSPPQLCGSVVDSYKRQDNHHQTLIMIDGAQAKNAHLFLKQHPNHFFTIED